ncbi:flagellar hook-associated protein FlgL [Cellulomonas hominis]
MITRVTQATVRQSTLANLQANLNKMSDLQAQMSSGKKINLPSDDPAGASDMMRLRSEQRVLTQYTRNAQDGNAWLTTVDTAITTSLANLRQVRDLTVRGGNGSLGDSARQALAAEISGLRDSLLEQSNTTYLGRSVFAGTSADAAFTVVPPSPPTTTVPSYTFSGVPGSTVTRQVADGTSIRVDSDGSAVFGQDPDTVFALLDSIVATLNAGGDPSDQLTAIDSHLDAMQTELSGVGARENQVDNALSRITDQQLTAKTRLSSIEDVDLAEIILDVQTQEVAYKGALGATAKVLQPTLLDYLR